MRIAVLPGNPEDERHLGRLAERAGLAPVFIRAGGAPPASPAPVLEHVLERLEREGPEAYTPGRSHTPHRPRALVFDPGARPDIAVRLLGAVRCDPYFERVGTLLMLHAELAATLALPGGFDDFVLYPCSVEELFIRVRALGARRLARRRLSPIDDAGVVVDESSRDVIVDGHAVQLTAREFALFTYLCEWRGQVLSREHLLARVWGSRYSGGRRTVDIHVRRLRSKLGASLAIETLRGSGYRLRREPPSDVAQTPYPADVQPFSDQVPEPLSKVS